MKRTAQILTLVSVVCMALLGQVSLAAQASQGEEPPAISTLQISLWPEFDRPDMLVIYRGLLTPDTPLPAPMEIRIPAGAGAPSAVAYVDDQGQRLNLEYTTQVEGEELVVSFDLPTQSFQLEYYETLPMEETGERTYTFDFGVEYAIGELTVEFQVPPTARDFSLDPAADSVVSDSGDLAYHLVQLGPLAQGETRSWTLSYDKDNAELTVTSLDQGQAPAAEPAAALPTGGGDSTVLIFVIAFVALVAVGAASFWLGRRTGSEEEPPVEAPFPARKKRPGRGKGPGLYCHKCGAELRLDSEFCHKCGTAVRVE